MNENEEIAARAFVDAHPDVPRSELLAALMPIVGNYNAVVVLFGTR